MKCGCKIIPIIIIIIFLTTLIVCALFTAPNLQVSLAKVLKLRTLIGSKNTKTKYFNISPSPSPLPCPSPAPAPANHVGPHSHGRIRHHLPLTVETDGGRKRRFLVAVLVSVGGATCVICLIGLFLGYRKLRKQRKRKSSSKNVKKVISDRNFYLESLGTVLDPPPICSSKQECDDGGRNFTSENSQLNEMNQETEEEEQEEKDGRHKDLFMMQRLSHCENLDSATEIVASIESLKFDEEDEQVFFGSPIGEEIKNVESQSSDDESFHSFCDSNHSSIPRNSSASISSDTLEPPTSSPPPPPPPPPPPRWSCSPRKSDQSNKTLIPPPPLPPFPKISDVSKSCDRVKTPAPSPPPPAPPPLPPPPGPSGSTIPPKAPLKTLKFDPSLGSNQTRIPPPPLPPPPPPPTGKDGTPLPKLKPLHWDKVRAAPDSSMVWDKLRTNSFEFDEEMIESLFGYNIHNSNEELKSKSPSPSKHVLEPKRLQNLTILLKALNVTAEHVCGTLVQGNGLNLQQLEVLIKMEPTEDEEAKITGFKGDLGSAETFVASILRIPYAFPRIEALLYRETFEDEVTHLRKTFSMLEEACKELRSSRLFLKLLEAVLKTGNRMNVGTIRGGAKAFKLDALLKLADVKGTDGKTTLLHFVVQEIVRSEGVRVSESIIGKINQKGRPRNIQDREQDYKNMGLELVGGLSTELCNVKRAATIDFDVIASSVSNLSQGMDRLRRLVNEDLSLEGNKCGFVDSMKSFLNHARKHLDELEEDEHKVLQLVKEITEYYHGNMSKDEVNPLRIFVIVRDFLTMLDLVCRELRRSNVFGNPNPLVHPFQ